MKLALYKGTRPGLAGVYNRVTRLIDRGPYSHCELLFSCGLSASSSFIDGGVRFKDIAYTTTKNWDFLPLPNADEPKAFFWFMSHRGLPYDVWGNLRFASNFARDCPDKWFCSEAVMAALGYSEAYRYGPSGMATLLLDHLQTPLQIGAAA